MIPGSVVVSYLHPGEIPTKFHDSLVGLLMHPANHGRIVAKIDRRNGANVSYGRNWVAATFLDESAGEWLLTLDADMVFEPDLLDRLLEVADPAERPVVAALYFGRDEDGVPFPQMYGLLESPDRPGDTISVRFEDYPKGLIEVAGTGAGCMVIHRSVLERMRAAGHDPVFPWYQETTEVNGRYTSEDITFCHRVRQLGHPVYVDTRIVCGHVKDFVIDEALFEAIRAYRTRPVPEPTEGRLLGVPGKEVAACP